MKKLLLIAILLSGNVFADYGYGEDSANQSHVEAEQAQRNNNLNNDYNSAQSNPSNYHRNEGYGLT